MGSAFHGKLLMMLCCVYYGCVTARLAFFFYHKRLEDELNFTITVMSIC